MKSAILLPSLALCLFAPAAGAALKTGDLTGVSVEKFSVPGKRPELCVIPHHLNGFTYARSDEKIEADLCAIDSAGEKAAACPKLNSTNPGVLFLKPPKGVSKEDFLAKNCEMDGSKKLAKYKLSTSCSYTPSLLGYYHVSRALGTIVRVPPAVLRTMDRQRHQQIAQKALKLLSKKPEQLIYQTWSGLKSILDRGSSHPKADLILTDAYDQSYGALQQNPKGDEVYSEFFNAGADRVAAFRDNNKIYRALTMANFSISRDYNKVNVQAMMQLRDAADFILLDTIMGQQDRMGNIHYQLTYVYPSEENGKFKLAEKKDLDEIPVELQSKAVQVKAMLLKDNDCGVAKTNRIKEGKLLDRVAHMNPETYRNLLKLERALQAGSTREFFERELLFTEKDFRTVAGNIQEAAKMLRSRCQAGQLKLDLDLDSHFSGAALDTRRKCDL
jgi:hypothetical protein